MCDLECVCIGLCCKYLKRMSALLLRVRWVPEMSVRVCPRPLPFVGSAGDQMHDYAPEANILSGTEIQLQMFLFETEPHCIAQA